MIDTRKLVNINGWMTSESELNVGIPDEYKELIYSVKYNDYAELSRALMFAHCAQEGRRFGDARQVRINESELKYCINRLLEKNGMA